MKEKKVTVALIGMGGYGINYVNEILNNSEAYGMTCVAMADVCPEKCKYYEDVRAQGIPIYPSLEALYENHQPDLLFISTPIQFHCRQTCFALKHGSHVLCEKPIAATLENAEKMFQTAKETNLFVAIGFQRCYNSAVLAAKNDAISGRYGSPIKFKSIIGQRRNLAYFQRGWAGKLKAGDDYIYDSVANNSSAHYLHNLFFMAGEALNTSAFPDKIEAECYRGNHIENYDTITAKIRTTSGIDLYFAAFQCGEKDYKHYACCQFEKGTITFEQDGRIVGRLDTGETIDYGKLSTGYGSKVLCAVEAVRGKDTIFCDINTAMAHIYTIQYIQDHVEVQDLTDRSEVINVAKEGETPELIRCVKGLDEAMLDCFRREAMLSSWYKGERGIN